MNALMTINQSAIGDASVQTVNARDLHAFLGSKRQFADWIKERIQSYDFVENQDFVIISQNCEKSERGRPTTDYALTLNMAKELSMVERNARGKQARLYFIECERQAKAASQSVMPDPKNLSRLQLIQLALDAETERLALEQQIHVQAPKVAFHDAVTESINCQTVQEVAKVLGTGPNKLFQFLREEGMLLRNNLPYQSHLDAGHFRVVEKCFRDEHGERNTYTRTLVTGKGLIYIQKRLQSTLPLLAVA